MTFPQMVHPRSSLAVAALLFLSFAQPDISRAAAIKVDISPDIVVSNGGSTTISFSAIADVDFPDVEVNNTNNEFSWSVRTQTNAANGVLEGTDPFEVRRFEVGETVSTTALAIGSIFAKPLWDDRFDAEWTAAQPSRYIGLYLSGSAGRYAAWIEVEVDPADNGMPIVKSFSYETTPNTDLIISAIPEPTAPVLILVGLLATVTVRRRAHRR